MQDWSTSRAVCAFLLVPSLLQCGDGGSEPGTDSNELAAEPLGAGAGANASPSGTSETLPGDIELAPAAPGGMEPGSGLTELAPAYDNASEDLVRYRSGKCTVERALPAREPQPAQSHPISAAHRRIFEERTADVVQAASRSWQERRSSSLRRYVRQYCLSGVSP